MSKVAVTAMADHVAGLLGADVAVAVSGVAGPAPQDDQPPGTVWLAVRAGGRTHTGSSTSPATHRRSSRRPWAARPRGCWHSLHDAS